ncbi:MAG: glycerol-3-phosphate dehydrogenase [Clostridiales bacterium GWF2_38_85]|nr:MAG: glycerol-3-phosphate dehydrogenase [Clostridiales bacterium GWF2_38_85]HBL85067.1 glycerol-3-phosphate dehydrogenase [Clostridiales bacterium]
MEISVIGCGRWGSFIAWYLNKIGHSVLLYGREGSKHMKQFQETRTNGLVSLPAKITLTTNLEEVMSNDVIIISVDSQGLRGLMNEITRHSPLNKIFVLCMKGLEISTGKRLSEVAAEYVGQNNNIAVWLGPGHVQEFLGGIPNCMVIDSENKEVKEKLIDEFSNELIRFYIGEDLIGNEIGAAAKNVIGIAAGMLDGLKLSSLKGALMSRGTREISRLIKALGGNELSAYGLCHLGDYEATIFSEFSHNRKFGEMHVKGEKFDRLAEGYYTAKALQKMSAEYEVELPICDAVYKVLYEGKPASEVLQNLFLRSLKTEFWS